jgi:hypothetical protein
LGAGVCGGKGEIKAFIAEALRTAAEGAEKSFIAEALRTAAEGAEKSFDRRGAEYPR